MGCTSDTGGYTSDTGVDPVACRDAATAASRQHASDGARRCRHRARLDCGQHVAQLRRQRMAHLTARPRGYPATL